MFHFYFIILYCIGNLAIWLHSTWFFWTCWPFRQTVITKNMPLSWSGEMLQQCNNTYHNIISSSRAALSLTKSSLSINIPAEVMILLKSMYEVMILLKSVYAVPPNKVKHESRYTTLGKNLFHFKAEQARVRTHLLIVTCKPTI